VSEREGRRTEGASGYQNQKQKPHKSMWGINIDKKQGSDQKKDELTESSQTNSDNIDQKNLRN
jgi:lipoprotein NlpI